MRVWIVVFLTLGLSFHTSAETATQEPSNADLSRKSYIEKVSRNPTRNQLARKARSIAQIAENGILYSENLPVIVDESEALRRSDREVAARALAVMITAVKGETNNQSLTEAVIADYDAADLFTDFERAFIESSNPPQDMNVQMSWRYESVAVLLWSIGVIEELPEPDQIIDAALLGNVFHALGAEGLYKTARLRPLSEILDATDMAYRLHWAVVDARVNGAPPPERVSPGIAYERHYAFNWLIGYAGLEWDNMATDT